MYAIIDNGGKQYKTFEGEYIEIDLLPDEVGKKKSFDKVLLLSTDEKVEAGEPFLKGVSVEGTILSHFKGPKLIVFKYRAKQRFRVKTGHRQKYTRVMIDSIAFPGKAEVEKKSEQEEPEEKKTASVKKTVSTAKKATEKVVKSTPSVAKKPPAAKSKTVAKKPTTAKKPAAKKPAADKK
ncbi:MAG: 50S ribosomal protein L21 [Pelolinea sp.]|nr:50S ribosomal protein L21 [Pelolinea sp.]